MSRCEAACCVSCLLVAVVLVPTVAQGETLHVPSEYSTIHAGLVCATAGDTVLVAPGTYPETSDSTTWIHPGPGVCLMSQEGADLTIIELCEMDGVWLFDCDGARVSGFTFRYRDEAGCIPQMGWPAGIMIWRAADVVVENCVITGIMFGITFGGGVAQGNEPVIRNNRISSCEYGLACDVWDDSRPSPLFEGNIVTDCKYGVGVWESSPRFERNTFAHCRFSGMEFTLSGGVCNRNTIAYNGLAGCGDCGGVMVRGTTGPDGLWFNEPGRLDAANDFYANVGFDIRVDGGESTFEVGASGNYWGGRCPDFAHKITPDVSFIPWTDSMHAALLYPKDCPGATEPATWGAIKALFR